MKKNKVFLRLLSVLSVVAIAAGFLPAAMAAPDTQMVYVSSTGEDTAAGTESTAPLATLRAAYSTVADGGTITLLDDMNVAEKIIFDQDKAVTIDGGGNTITYASSATIGPDRYGFFTVEAGALALANVTVKLPDRKGANGRVLYVTGGSATLEDGATLANGYLGYGGGGVLITDGGTLTMEDGATIRDCSIVNNTTAYGGGVRVANGGTFAMIGGTITTNTIHTTLGYDSFGGGVAIEAGGTFRMSGGDITGNSVGTAGGGIYVAPGGALELAGDLTITGNTVAGAANNLYLPTTGEIYAMTAGVTGNVGITHGEADYSVIVGVPDGYTIQATDEAAYTYDTGAYDIRLKGGNLLLYYWTVDVTIDGDHFDSTYADDETVKGEDFNTTLTPEDGYQLPGDITVEIGGQPSTDYTYDPDTGAVHIPGRAVTDDITITATPDALYTITVDVEHTQADTSEVVVIQADTTTITFSRAPRYGLPAGVTVSGLCDHDYDSATGQIVITNVAGDVAVSATGSEVYHDLHFDAAGGSVDPSTVTVTESQAVEGANRKKTPNEIALQILLVALSIIFVLVTASLYAYSVFSAGQLGVANPTSVVSLVALLICLAPTTIGALLSAIGIAGMSRLNQANVLAMSGRAIEAAGDVDVLLLDKTGTITLGNRQAVAFLPVDGCTEQELADAAQLSSLPDETPEGRSIVVLAKEQFGIRGREVAGQHMNFIPFTAQTRMSGVDCDAGEIRKGAADAVRAYVEAAGGTFSAQCAGLVDDVARQGGTPLVVARDHKVLGVIHLKDIIKDGVKEKFADLRKMGIKTIMITGDNPVTAAAIAAEAGVDDFLSEATPEAKLDMIRKFQAEGHLVAMTGDGTNDAPALAQADVAVAMNSGTQAAKEAGNMVDLDSSPTKLIEIVRIGKQLLMTRGSLTTFSIANDIAKYFAIIPALFMGLYPGLAVLNIMGLASPTSAILSALIYNALIIVALIPLALKGVKYREVPAGRLLGHNLLVYGLGGIAVPFLAIKAIDLVVAPLLGVL